MTVKLNSHLITTTFNTVPTIYQGAGAFKLEVPQSSVTVAKPVSYDFRVAEYINKDGTIAKVGLQYRIWEHDNYGEGNVIQDWTDVERIKVNL
jgi:hypothetical protein